jgi:SAM-dependent methyltransferase
MGDRDFARLYDAYYFAHGCGEPYQRSDVWLSLFKGFAERIHVDINPGTVLDAGCAMGFLVETLRERGIEAWGVDISNYAIDRVAPTIKEFCWVGSVTEPFPSQYDMIVSIEVLEHLERKDSEKAVLNLCQHSNDILFSSTPFDYKEISHFNVQPPEYWAEQFARQGFYRDVDFDASFITPWAVRYMKKSVPLHRVVRDYERKYWLLWKENADLRELSKEMRDQLAENEFANSQQTGDQINQNSQINVQDNPSWLKRWLLKGRRFIAGG